MVEAIKTVAAATSVTPIVTAQQAVTPQTLASILKDKGSRSSFVTFTAEYPMDNPGKMTKKNNPFIGQGIRKISRTQVTVNWSSTQDKVEKRGGEFSGKGNWMQAVLIGNKVTPLAVHKDDIKTTVVLGLPDKLANRRAVVQDGLLIYTAQKPRFYLRYEVLRESGTKSRDKRKMRSTSHYVAPNGSVIGKKRIEPFLPKKQPRKDETDIQVTALENLTELRIDGTSFKII
jgi:hypothetical protein